MRQFIQTLVIMFYSLLSVVVFSSFDAKSSTATDENFLELLHQLIFKEFIRRISCLYSFNMSMVDYLHKQIVAYCRVCLQLL